MSENKIIIMPAQMKVLARYEDTFARYTGQDDIEEYKFEFAGEYKITLEDLYQAVLNMLEKNPTVEEFGKYWYYPITEYCTEFGIEAYCGYEYSVDDLDDDDFDDFDDEDIDEEDTDSLTEETVDHDFVRCLPIEENEIFEEVWIGLEDIWSMEDEDVHLKDLPQMEVFRESLKVFLENRDKPVAERDFTDTQKYEFIYLFEDDDWVKNATDAEISLCRRFTDELCRKDSVTALRIKGYGCYGGNRLYPCDWKTSRDCMERLFELTGAPVYANTLGYIYYYGRCTGGQPEYEKAFEMYSIAAANGMHEALYKLADMYYHGYACRKSPATARSLYGMVYDDCYRQLLDGSTDGSFTDAALRMGNVFLKGIAEEINAERAYSFYLQAEMTSRLRAMHSDFFGNASVALGISKAKEEARSLISEDFFKDHLSLKQPWLFAELVKEGYRAEISFIDREDGPIRVKVSRIPYPSEDDAKPLLVTIPEMDYCDVITEMEFEAYNLVTSFNIQSQTPVRYDQCNWNYTENRLDFYFNGMLIGWIACDEYRINRPAKKEKGQSLKFVSVAFKEGGKTYDYLCELDDVNIGDRVIVPGYDGEQEVDVLAVFIKHESDLGIPVERYKRVIRKADQK